MATPTHMLIVIRGKFLNTPEAWSYSMKFSRDSTGLPDANANDVQSPAMRTALLAFHNTGMFSTGCQVDEWRAYVIGTDGKMQGNPNVVPFAAADVIKGTGTVKYPTNVSLAVTTEADNRGKARLGRFYLPGLAYGLGADHRLSVSDAGVILSQAVTFTKAVSNAINFPAGSNQGSEMLNISRVGTGTRQTVKRLRVGKVLDSIERRRRQMVEDYTVSGNIDW